jgi:two-component system, NtrC family, sensor kinase
VKKISIATRFLSESGEVEVVFWDNGIGIPDEIKEKILEPFFTTKEVGTATGLGLSISYGIIENHGGKISVHSREKEETVVTVSLKIGS